VSLDARLIDILVCPESKAPLIYFEDEAFLFCPESRLRYPIVDGIPVMLIDEAERLDEDAAAALVATARAHKLID
jgi:uncharacterized protein YbaR (Trm112 family)